METKGFIWIGSYAHLLYGLDENLTQQVLHSSHSEPLTVAAASGSLLATGSADTTVWVYKGTKEVGVLQRHTGSITALCFYKIKHLLSASTDGTICVWRLKDWECLLQRKAHTKGVRALALHPSGRMALSLGEGSRKAKLWNLATGQEALVFKLVRGSDAALSVPSVSGEKQFVKNDGDLPLQCCWSASGDMFLIQWAAQVDVFRVSDGAKAPIVSFAFDSKVTCCLCAAEGVVLAGTDDGAVVWLSVAERRIVRRETLPGRVRQVALFGESIVAITTAGHVTVLGGKSVSLSDRLTCLAVSTHEKREPRAAKKSKTVV
jgi:WD40 repeat protein